jgi:aerobic carbon-monoxide dehydrogenase small subunit
MSTDKADSSISLTLTVNGSQYQATAEPRRLLSDFLREDCGMKGVKVSCDIGICGACTVLMGGELVRSCLMLAVQADGEDLVTVEGLSSGSLLSTIQEAFWDCHALQCGFCTPGMLIAAHHLLEKNPNPTDGEIRSAISGNLCRCTGYIHIVRAIRVAAERMRNEVVKHPVLKRASP